MADISLDDALGRLPSRCVCKVVVEVLTSAYVGNCVRLGRPGPTALINEAGLSRTADNVKIGNF